MKGQIIPEMRIPGETEAEKVVNAEMMLRSGAMNVKARRGQPLVGIGGYRFSVPAHMLLGDECVLLPEQGVFLVFRGKRINQIGRLMTFQTLLRSIALMSGEGKDEIGLQDSGPYARLS